MKNLLLTAKYLAKQDNSDEIKIEYIKEALKYLEFIDIKIKKEIFEYLTIKTIENEHLIKEEDLEKIEQEPTIPYELKVKEFIQFLKLKGFFTKDCITRLYYDESKENAKLLIELGKIKTILQDKIFDQDIAIEAVKDTISKALFEEKENSVKATLFFVGPPATGKTFLSEETGKLLEKYGYITKVFNMTMYSDETSNLTGLSDPMKGAGKGELTKFIEANPKSLIVFDEIEKCHIQKQMDLFRLLDRGVVEDKYDESIIDASNCILIFTSNLGKEIYDRTDYSKLIRDQKETESLILQAIAKEKHIQNPNMLAITPPLTSRLSASKIILFNKVGLKAYFSMSKKEIERYFEIIKKKFKVNFEISDDAILASFLQYLPFFDPRRIKGKLGDDVFDLLRDYIQQNQIELTNFKTIKIDVDNEIQTLLKQNFIQDMNFLLFNDTRFLELIDKKQTLFMDNRFLEKKNELFLEFFNPRIEKIKNIQDFDGEVKIELDIPTGKIEGEPNANIFGHEDTKKMLVRIANKIKKFQKLRRENNSEALKVLENIPKGILLYGPPGTGKTKIARAFAAQVEVPIIVSSGKDMTTVQYTGTGIQNIKNIFKKARDYAPSILFIDEIDAMGIRGQDSNGEQDKNINTILEEIDGFRNDKYKPVFVIAATNRKDRIDPAILRSGRIEEHIEISSLSKEARTKFTNFMFNSDSDFSDNIDIRKFIEYTVGMNGSQLEQVFKKARYTIDLLREEKNDESLKIDLELLLDIINEIRYGKIDKKRADAKFENMITAYHEAGHAISSFILNPDLPINQITITPRGDFNGFVSFNHDEIYRIDKKFIMAKIATAYGGRVAEEIFFEKNHSNKSLGLSAGASQDIKFATNLIQDAILKYGMDNKLGLVDYTNLKISDKTQELINTTIIEWQNEAKELCIKTLNENWNMLEKVVIALIGDGNNNGNETLDSQWIKDNLNFNT